MQLASAPPGQYKGAGAFPLGNHHTTQRAHESSVLHTKKKLKPTANPAPSEASGAET